MKTYLEKHYINLKWWSDVSFMKGLILAVHMNFIACGGWRSVGIWKIFAYYNTWIFFCATSVFFFFSPVPYLMARSQRQTVRNVPLAHQRALIPPSFIDFPLQRLIATTIFTLLQTLKIFYAFRNLTTSYPEQFDSTGWLTLLDIVFVLCLYICRIPWLQFSLLKSLVLIMTFTMFNTLVFVGPVVSENSYVFCAIWLCSTLFFFFILKTFL